MRELIESDPRVKARFDTDGNGVIDGEEWEQVRQLVVRRLEREESERAARERLAAVQPVEAASPDEEDLPVVVGAVATQIYTEDLPGMAGAPAGGVSLAACHDLIIEERGLAQYFFGPRRNYALLTPGGQQVGEVQQREMEWLQHLTAKVGAGVPDLHFDVIDSVGGERYTFKRSAELFGQHVAIFDGADRQVGYVEEKLGVLKPSYRIVSTFERSHISVKWSLLHPFTLTVCDLMGDPIGKVERGWSGLGMFLTGPDRMRVHTDAEQFNPAFRWGLVAACVLAEMGQEQKDRGGGLLDTVLD